MKYIESSTKLPSVAWVLAIAKGQVVEGCVAGHIWDRERETAPATSMDFNALGTGPQSPYGLAKLLIPLRRAVSGNKMLRCRCQSVTADDLSLLAGTDRACHGCTSLHG